MQKTHVLVGFSPSANFVLLFWLNGCVRVQFGFCIGGGKQELDRRVEPNAVAVDGSRSILVKLCACLLTGTGFDTSIDIIWKNDTFFQSVQSMVQDEVQMHGRTHFPSALQADRFVPDRFHGDTRGSSVRWKSDRLHTHEGHRRGCPQHFLLDPRDLLDEKRV